MVGYYDPEDDTERCMACKMADEPLFAIKNGYACLMLCGDCVKNAPKFAGYPSWTPTMNTQRAYILEIMEKQHASRH